jgi:glycosyltransferase involved in cell wall biosynthesis
MAESFRDYLLPAIRQSGMLLSISEHTRRDLQLYARQEGVALPPVEVVRLGEDLPSEWHGPAPTVEGLTPGRPFVLCVSTVEVRKNHQLLYHLWRRLAQRHGDRLPQLLLIGVKGWLADDLVHQFRTDPLTQRSIVHLPHCQDHQLQGLYRHCLFTVYPSHYEGWGLPVAEALGHGKAVVCSNAASLPEIAPELCELLDPCDLPAWQRAVERLLFDPGELRAREDRARREFRRTTWADTAAQCLAHLERHFGPAFRPAAPALARSA